MKAVILAGGFGTRLSEYTGTIPKPMVPVGGRPILEHIIKLLPNWHKLVRLELKVSKCIK